MSDAPLGGRDGRRRRFPGPGGAPDQRFRPPLRRGRDQKVISGVCGGLGRYCDLDPVIFRVVLAVLGVAGGLGLIVYGFCWLLVPLQGERDNEGASCSRGGWRARR
ncbi:PspC domain-containing protein [Streptomyces sp. M19]